MTTAASLLRAILEEPAADDLRLIYADWLTDHDEPARGEFIRVQVEYAILQPHLIEHQHPYCRDCRRARYLSRLCQRRFCVPYSGTAPFAMDCPYRLLGFADHCTSRIEWKWHRGFVQEFCCTLAEWGQYGPVLVAVHPIEQVRLTDRIPLHDEGSEPPHYWPVAWCWSDGVDLSISWGVPPDWARITPSLMNLFTTTEQANNALSVAALNWARSKVVPLLPPLKLKGPQ